MDPYKSNGRTAQMSSGFGYAENYPVQFSDPWNGNRTGNPTSAPFVPVTTAASMSPHNELAGLGKQSLRTNSVNSSFGNMSLDALDTSRSMPSQSLYSTDLFNGSTGFAPSTYAEQTSGASPTAGATAYGMNGYNAYGQNSNKLANSLLDYTRSSLPNTSYTTADTLDTARGMINMAQNPTRFSLPTSHRNSSSASSSSYYPGSTSSSISSASSYPYYGSMDSSAATDISSLSDMYDTSRPSLPRPLGMNLHSQVLPNLNNGQQQMMGTFNSRPQANTTKKHKCKVCDKRFTRPSSLQTHMYSHTGEKPFACEVEGCGRQFSVVSNLRRHRKVHRGHSDTETISNAGSM